MQEKPKTKIGATNPALIIMASIGVLLFSAAACLSLMPQMTNIAEVFLPPYCDEQLFAEVMANPPAKMRVIKDIFWATRVIAVNDTDQDICFFRMYIYPGGLSPDGNYLAFTVYQSIPDNRAQQHFFIVNTKDGTYLRFSPENPEVRIEDIAWSPDSTKLAYISYSDFTCCVPPPDVYITLISPDVYVFWRVMLGNEDRYSWGNLLWTEDGEEIHYGRDEAFIMGKPMGQPFWCSVNQDGRNLLCEDVEIED